MKFSSLESVLVISLMVCVGFTGALVAGISVLAKAAVDWLGRHTDAVWQSRAVVVASLPAVVLTAARAFSLRQLGRQRPQIQARWRLCSSA